MPINTTLPAGFTLDEPSVSSPDLPEGFTLDTTTGSSSQPATPAGFTLDEPIQQSVMAPPPPSDVLPAQFQLPETSMGPFEANPSIGAGFMNNAKDIGRKFGRLKATALQGQENFISDTIGGVKLDLARMFIGDEELNRRSAEAEPTLSATPLRTDPFSQSAQREIQSSSDMANRFEASQLENPVDRSGRTSIEDIIADPLNIPQIGKFGLETAVESAPEMILAALGGPVLSTASIGQGIAEERAVNQGRDRRDVTAKDQLEAAPAAVISALLERVGIKGLGSKGGSALSRTGKATVKEGATEGVQEPLETIGGTAFTDKELTKEDLGKSSLSGVIGGATMGGSLKVTGEVGAAAKRAITSKKEISQASPVVPDNAADQAAPAAPVAADEDVGGQTPASPEAPEASIPSTDPPAQTRPEKAIKVVTPEGGVEVEVENQVVDIGTLKEAEGDLQPRNRDKVASDIQIQKIASELDPARLAESRTTDRGAPVVGSDNVVDSGNGRVAALRLAQKTNPEGFAAYKQSLVDAGHDIAGIEFPILIRRRTTDMTKEERINFNRLSNKDDKAQMSSAEKAISDAKVIDDDLLNLHKGGAIDSAANTEFMKSFIQKVSTPSELGSLIDGNGRPTQEGVKKARAAMVAKAYNNPDLVENIFDSADPEVKSIGNVLSDQAPAMSQLTSAIKNGSVPERFDIAEKLMDAVELIRNAKRDKKRVKDVIDGTNQASLIEEESLDPLVEQLVRSMHQEGLGRMLSQADLTRVIDQYITQAKEQTGSDLFGENKTTPETLLQSAYDKVLDRIKDRKADTGQDGFAFDELQDKAEGAGELGSDEELAQSGGRTFMDFAENHAVSLDRTVFKDIGIDPDKAANMPPARQRKLIVDAFKNVFDLGVTFEGNVNIKDQIDQLMDMYVSMKNMSFSMGIPMKAMSLGGTVGLAIAPKRPYLGVYKPGKKQITIPNRSVSWAHEWMHSVDHYMIERFGEMDKHLFSGEVRKDGAAIENPVQRAFADVLNNIFFDEAFLAAKVIELEAKAKNGRTEKSRQDAERLLTQIRAGNYKGIKGKSDFYKSVKDFSDKPYWSSPEEMLARAVEAYTAFKIEEAGATPKGVAKSDLAYQSFIDERLAKSFPKEANREAIFASLDNFFSLVGEDSFLAEGDTATAITPSLDFLGVFDPKFFAKETLKGEETGWIKNFLSQVKEEVEANKAQRANNKEAKLRNEAILDKLNPKEAGFWPAAKRFMALFGDSSGFALWNHSWRTERTETLAIEKKYSSGAINELRDRVFSRPGDATAVDEEYAQGLDRKVNIGANTQQRITDSIGFKKATLADKKYLRDVFLGLEATLPKGSKFTEAQIKKMASGLRDFADTVWKRMDKAGFEIGYVADGAWLRRKYSNNTIMADPEAFLTAASKTYADQMENVFGDVAGAVDKIDDFLDVMRGILRHNAEKVDFDKGTIKAINKAVAEEDTEALTELVEEIYDDVSAAYAELAAEAWLANIATEGQQPDFESTFPQPGFMKRRPLPASADKHLEEFMETDVENILFHYMVAAETAIAQKAVFNPKGKKSMEQLMKQARKESVTSDDITTLEESINRVVKGPDVSPKTRKMGQAITVLRMGGILMNLNKVLLSSVAEPMVIGFKTRSVMRGYKAFGFAVMDALGTASAKEFQDIAGTIGLIGTDLADQMQANRFGGNFELGLVSRATMSKFFRYTGTTGITNIQSRSALRSGYLWLNHITDNLLDGKENQKSMAIRDLAELGIPREEAAAFAKWLKKSDGRPNLAEAVNDDTARYANMFVVASMRFRNQSIQHPKKEDRPALANHPVGAVLYTGLGFTFSFWDNVVKAEAKRAKDILKNEGGGEFVKVLANHTATMGSMLALMAMMNMLRMAVFDNDKWEETKDDDEKLMQLVMGRAFEQSNVGGPAYSVMWNMYRGTQYGKDPATSLSGMVLSNYLNYVQSGLNLFGDRNGAGNTTEREFVKQSFRVMAAPAITATMMHLPGPGKLIAAPIGAATMFLNSNSTADIVADAVAGPKKSKKKSSFSEPKEPREPREPKE